METTQTPQPDFTVVDHGSIVQFFFNTPEAKEFIDNNVELEGWQFMGKSFNVDHRYAEGLINGIMNDGLTIN